MIHLIYIYSRHLWHTASRKRVHIVLLMVCLGVLATVSAHAFSWREARPYTADDIEMVHLQDSTRYVCDPGNMLSEESRRRADAILHRMHQRNGVQTVFIVVNRVWNGDVFRFSQDVGNKYGVGTKRDRRGLIIVIATADRRYFIAPGKGLEEYLTDVECNHIGRSAIVANMQRNNLDAAVVQTAQAVADVVAGKGVKGSKDVDGSEGISIVKIVILVLIVISLPLYQLYLKLSGKGYRKRTNRPSERRRRKDDDDWFPPFIFGGGGGFRGGGGSFGGGSFGGGSFGGGGSGGSW